MENVMALVENDNPRVLARQALADTPLYVEHVRGLMEKTVLLLRNGEDQSAMTCFAQGAFDLTSFLELMQHLVTIAHSETNAEAQRFEQQLIAALGELRPALEQQDFVTLSDQLEASLLPVFPIWPRVAEELGRALDAQAD